MDQGRTKTVQRKVTPKEKLVIDIPGVGAIEIACERTAELDLRIPCNLAWREEEREAKAASRK